MLVTLPGTPSLLFLCYLLIFMPMLAIRSSRRLRQVAGEQGLQTRRSREAIWYSTLCSECILLALAWIVGNGFDFRIFQPPAQQGFAAAAAGLALLALFIIRAIARRFRGHGERRQMIVYSLAPRSIREWQLKLVTVLAASIAEEAAYRGVAMAILWDMTRNQVLAALVCSVAFAVVHWVQGWKSMLVIFLIAVVMHVLVAWTQTLVYAMGVHFVYDVIAIWLIWQEARRLQVNS